MTNTLINQSFRAQRVTGQQRYAAEITARLQHKTGFEVRHPRGVWAHSKAAVWAWVQVVLPLMAGRRVVLSLTSRAPVRCRRQVLVVHDLFAIAHPEWYSRTYYWTHAPLLRAQIRTAAALVAVSQPVADELIALGRENVVVAPNAPSAVFSEVDDQPSDVLTNHCVRPGTFLLAVGSLDPRKNLRRLSQAYAGLDRKTRLAHPLVVVGGGASIYRDEVLPWPEGTVQAGYVDDDELRRLYRDAATVVFVSLAEGFGLPLVEARAAGANSMLVSDIAVFRWICGDGARYVDPQSVSAIAEGIEDEIREPSVSTIKPGRFTWEASAAIVAQVCRDVGEEGP